MLKRKGLVLCLVGVLLLSMTACSIGGGETPQTTPTTTGGDTTTTTTTAPPTGGEETPAETVEVTLGETSFALGDAVFTIGGDPRPLHTMLEGQNYQPIERYESLDKAGYEGNWFVSRTYKEDVLYADYNYVHTVKTGNADAERLVNWITSERRYTFNGVSVGMTLAELAEQWGENYEVRERPHRGAGMGSDSCWVYPYNAAYDVTFYYFDWDVSRESEISAIGIEAATPVQVDGTVARKETVSLAVTLNDEAFSVNGLSLTDGCEAVPLFALLGTPLAVDANGYTDADPNSWFTVYTYDGCEVETWKPKDGSAPERFCRLLLTGEQHTVNGVAPGDTCQTVVAALTPHFAAAAALGGNYQWRPPFDLYVEFTAASGISLQCGLGKEILNEEQMPVWEIVAYNDRAVGMLAVG